MTVISDLFEKISTRIPDAQQAQEVLAAAVKADPTKGEAKARAAKAADRTGAEKDGVHITGLIEDALKLGEGLEKMHASMTIECTAEWDDNMANFWKRPPTGANIKLMHKDEHLLSFTLSRVDDGGYYVRAEEIMKGPAMTLTMADNHPEADIKGVEKSLAAHLDSAFNLASKDAAQMLELIANAVDERPAQFINIIKTRPFDEVLAFVKDGIDPAHVYTEYPGNFHPLDWVLMSRHDDNEKAPPFTPEQRRELFEAVVAQVNDKTGIFVDAMTMHQAALNNCADLFPRLVELGCRPAPEDFVDAGGHRSNGAGTLTTLKVLLPYVGNVNVTADGRNAGHRAAEDGDYQRFLWLENQGLDKEKKTSGNFPTYAHCVARGAGRKKAVAGGGKDVWPEFLHHLIDNSYAFDANGMGGTPLETAVQEGQLDLARILLDAGAKPSPEVMAKAVTAVYCNHLTVPEATSFMSFLHDTYAVSYQRAVDELYDLLRSASECKFFDARWDGFKPMSEVAGFLAAQGAAPAETRELSEFRATAAAKLRGADAKALNLLGIEALPVLPPPQRARRPAA